MDEQNPSIEDLQKENKDLKEELEKYKKREKATHNALVWTGGRLLNVFIGKDLKENLHAVLKKISIGRMPNAKESTNLIEAIVHRLLRFPLIQFILSILTLVTIILQVWLAFRQTDLMESQTKLMITQNNLEEANRRSSLVFSFSNIMDQVNEELKDATNAKRSRSLSPQLIGRISALAQGLKPYRYLEGDSLIEKPLSPERGQLLLALINSKLDTLTYDEIFKTTPFKNVDLQGVNLKGIYLKSIDLNEANLEKVILDSSNLIDANLLNANFKDVSVKGTLFSRISFLSALNSINSNQLYSINLSKQNLSGLKIPQTFFHNCNLSYINLSNSNMINSTLIYSDLQFANFTNTNISSSFLSNSNLKSSSFIYTNLSNSILSYSDLRNIKVKEVMIKDTRLDFCIINDLNLFKNLDEVKKKYLIDSISLNKFEHDFIRLEIDTSRYDYFQAKFDSTHKLYLLVPIKKEE
jgi:uncharacterized protein YjbI with pentapeptide repeats